MKAGTFINFLRILAVGLVLVAAAIALNGCATDQQSEMPWNVPQDNGMMLLPGMPRY